MAHLSVFICHNVSVLIGNGNFNVLRMIYYRGFNLAVFVINLLAVGICDLDNFSFKHNGNSFAVFVCYRNAVFIGNNNRLGIDNSCKHLAVFVCDGISVFIRYDNSLTGIVIPLTSRNYNQHRHSESNSRHNDFFVCFHKPNLRFCA